jgi:hypothetical protein
VSGATSTGHERRDRAGIACRAAATRADTVSCAMAGRVRFEAEQVRAPTGKLVMSVQAITALLTVALVVARAVNILG